jgi:glyoxylase-like metal-dependent hydrolase (beta-lactamase superfamily II)
VLLLPAGNASTWTGSTGNNTYLLPGRIPTLIDAGVGAPEHVAAIDRALHGAPLAMVLITHSHVDHSSGVPALRQQWPDLAVRQFGMGSRPLVGAERIEAGDSAVTVLHTPGHSPDHCCFVHGRDIFCGDLVRIGGTIVIPASSGGDLALYLDSLQRVRDLNAARLLPGHGPIVANPARLIDEYLRHRLERERQVLDALQRGSATPEEIVAQIYEALPDELVPAAAESVRAHLIKLQNEGRVSEHDGCWTHMS